jgi:hypothetical protein
MATVSVTLGISSPDVLSTTVALNTATALTVDSGTIIRSKVADITGAVAETSGGAGDGELNGVTVYKANDKDTRAYVFVRNLSSILEDYIYVYNSTDSDLTYNALVEASVAKIGGGQFAFIPVAVDKTFKVYATKANQLVEYGVFGNDDPANTLE